MENFLWSKRIHQLWDNTALQAFVDRKPMQPATNANTTQQRH
jgi:hypothetical protein